MKVCNTREHTTLLGGESMNAVITRLLLEARGSYPGDILVEMLGELASELPERLDALAEVQREESVILERLCEQLVAFFPCYFEGGGERSVDALRESIQDVLRYAALAMLLDDMEMLERELLQWLAPALHVVWREDVMAATWGGLMRSCEDELTEVTYSRLRRFLSRAHGVLGAH